jgi:hypothetical protein
MEKEKTIANLKMDIDAAELKRIMASGNLTKFVENASDLAAQQIREQIFELLGKLALEAGDKNAKLKAALQVNIRFFDDDNRYGTLCVKGFCVTRCRVQETIADEVAAGVIAGMTQYSKAAASR